MGAIVLKYVQLICVAFFVKNSNCAHITDNEDLLHLKIGASIAECMSLSGNNGTAANIFETCYNECINSSSERVISFKHGENGAASFSLYCRDARNIIIKIDHDYDASQNETFLYMLKVKESTGKFTDRIYTLSDEKLINVTVDDLSVAETTTLSYNITAYIISSTNATVQKLERQQFTTLMPDYKPEVVTQITSKGWSEYYDENEKERRLNFTFTWRPERSHTCRYDVLFHQENVAFHDVDSHLEVYPVPFEHLYEYTMTNLKFDMDYSVSIRAVNSYNSRVYSREKWINFSSPQGEVPLEVTAASHHIEDDFFDVNVTWNKPQQQTPLHYQVEVKNLYSTNETGIYTALIDGTATFHVFKNIELSSSNFLLNITGYSENGNVYVHDYAFVDRPLIRPSKLYNVLFYIFVVLVVILLLFLIRVWRGRIDSFISAFAQKRIDTMDIEIIKTMSTGTVLDAIAELTKDNRMEVQRENITVLQLIGEGAFGLVKKGLIIKNGEKQYVAVKMIKNTSNLEDVRQFHQEISVMKSVGRHENIVSIVGHCTSDIKELLLLTEFCDEGSLLDLLRLEFAKQFKFYDTKGRNSVQFVNEKYPDSLLNFDMSESDKKEISYKNIGCSANASVVLSSKHFVVNQMYDELNNNVKNEALLKTMTATNPLYLKLNDQESQPTKIIEDEATADEFLTSSDLLSFAKQICDGMDFLARKKVVHRDLAARNILVCSNKTVKISDFGLSRDIYQDLFYKKMGNGKLPIKWLALESMTHQVYTSQSDVWSFGVLLYEIVTLGAVPYSSINVENLLKFLRAGLRLERPHHCHTLLYDLMMLCWHANPLDRPSFDELSAKLHSFLLAEDSWGEPIIDLSKMFTNA